MIGPKKLGEIRRELRQALKKDAKELADWLDERLGKIRGSKPRESEVAEDLLWVRDMLSGATGKPRKRRRRSEPLT